MKSFLFLTAIIILIGGTYSIGYDIGQQKSYDIDSEHDYEIIEFLMKQKHSE